MIIKAENNKLFHQEDIGIDVMLNGQKVGTVVDVSEKEIAMEIPYPFVTAKFGDNHKIAYIELRNYGESGEESE